MDLPSLNFYRLKIAYNVASPLHLPPYKGSSIRGAFGQALRQVSCRYPGRSCNACRLRYECPYAYYFESPVPAGDRWEGKYNRAPHPYVIEPPLTEKAVYETGAQFGFELLLIGNQPPFVREVLYSLHRLGENGLGSLRTRMTLLDIQYRSSQGRWKSAGLVQQPEILGMDNIRPAEGRKLKGLLFLSPAWLTLNSKPAGVVTPGLLLDRLYERMMVLGHFYHQHADIPYRQNFIVSENAFHQTRLQKISYLRDSPDPARVMKLAGFTGRISFTETMQEYLDLLVLGEQLHVGKKTVFGLGKYKLEYG